jgi:hypothetical protein
VTVQTKKLDHTTKKLGHQIKNLAIKKQTCTVQCEQISTKTASESSPRSAALITGEYLVWNGSSMGPYDMPETARYVWLTIASIGVLADILFSDFGTDNHAALHQPPSCAQWHVCHAPP